MDISDDSIASDSASVETDQTSQSGNDANCSFTEEALGGKEDCAENVEDDLDQFFSELCSLSFAVVVEKIKPNREPFIIVVRTPRSLSDWFGLKALERLRWISKTFPREKYPNRKLVLIHGGWIWHVNAIIGDVLWEWECHQRWDEVYVKLLSSGFRSLDPISKPEPWRWFDTFNCSQQFGFGAYINLRGDRDEAGFGYGLSERYEDRCPLRALLLATRGNTVCLDWGHPGDLGSNYRGCGSVAGVADMLDHDVFVFGGTRRRRQGKNQTMFGLPDGHHAQQPFARAIRNGHYLGSVSSALDQLPDNVVNQLVAGINGNLLTQAQVHYGHWLGWWELFFADDYRSISYHEWPAISDLQTDIIRRYVLAHRNWASSTWFEVVVDCATLLVAGLFFSALDARFSGLTPSIFFNFIVAPLTVAVWAIIWDIWANYKSRYFPLKVQDDRASHVVFAIEFFRAALFAPILARPVLILAYRHLGRKLLSSETRWWYVEIRLKEPIAAAKVEAVYVAVLMCISLAFPWTASTWGDTLAWMYGNHLSYSCSDVK